MKDILQGLQSWVDQKKNMAFATVVKTWGSAPRKVGSVLVVSEDMEMLGSVSGGCVEGAVVKEALEVIQSGVPKSLSFGVSNEDAWEVGLSCGGELHVFLERFPSANQASALWEEIATAIAQNKGCIWLSTMEGDSSQYSLIYPDGTQSPHGVAISDSVLTLALEAFSQRKEQVLELGTERYFAHIFPPKSRLLIMGAAHITVDLVDLAKQFGFECIVIDPRGIFSEKTQFRVSPDQLHVDWPAEVLPQYTLDAYTYAVLLSHDPKIDDQALHLLLKSDVAYIGALGGRKTQQKRRSRLAEAGYSETEIDRIKGPIGMDIHAQSAQEIALSILGELIQAKNHFL